LIANLNFFDYIYKAEPSRGTRFGKAMQGVPGGHILTDVYTPLHTFSPGSTFVDIGGGLGHVSIKAAQKLPQIKFIVQDLEEVIAEGREEVCPDALKGRVQYQANNFFEGQPVKGADVYYMRHILHDHPDTSVPSISLFP
jgi:sterigmatocystin 8-O-methyltransferase